MVIAPATASTISKLAHGQSDNIIAAVYLSAKCPVFIAPAMDLDMWVHPSTQRNIVLLESYGDHIIDVGDGELASGLVGKGRLAEPDDIVLQLSHFFTQKSDLTSKKVMITAGPTYEAIDPVRFIGNHSSGKMGVALAKECAHRGAQVTLILGPSRLSPNHENIELVNVTSGEQMYESAEEHHQDADIVIFTAAVADYRPKTFSHEKIKKDSDSISIELEKTVDIAATLGKNKKDGQIHVGFALETQKEESNAQKKLKNKQFDLIVLNSLRDKGAGFKGDTNLSLIHISEPTRPY